MLSDILWSLAAFAIHLCVSDSLVKGLVFQIILYCPSIFIFSNNTLESCQINHVLWYYADEINEHGVLVWHVKVLRIGHTYLTCSGADTELVIEKEPHDITKDKCTSFHWKDFLLKGVVTYLERFVLLSWCR